MHRPWEPGLIFASLSEQGGAAVTPDPPIPVPLAQGVVQELFGLGLAGLQLGTVGIFVN